MTSLPADDRLLRSANRTVLRKLAVMAVVMFGFGFALVPFYEKICQVAGIRNVFQPDRLVSENTQVDLTRKVSIEFDSNTQRLAWSFKPLENHLEVHPGELTQVVYEIRNNLNRRVIGQAVPSYGPSNAAEHFKKLECFCFQQQTFEAGETRRMPVTFLIDPALPASVNTITLSYTFFEVAGTQPTVAAGKGS